MADAPLKVVIDTDPGIDDAVAILFALACGRFQVLGLPTVAGNLGIRVTTRNAGRILALAGRADIPVVPGAAAPLSRTGFDTKEIHGDDGLGGVPFPEPVAPPLAAGAVEWLAETLRAQPAGTLDILALGPLTNIARLVAEHPQAARRMRRLIAMGGGVHEPGNVGPRSEFNLAADPEAAQVVFSAGLPLTLVPLDVTRRVRATHDYCAALAAAGTPVAAAAAGLIEAYFLATSGRESRPLHDPCVMLFALRPDLFGCRPLALAVDTGHGADAGALVPDPARPPIHVAMQVDAQAALDLLARGLGA